MSGPLSVQERINYLLIYHQARLADATERIAASLENGAEVSLLEGESIINQLNQIVRKGE